MTVQESKKKLTFLFGAGAEIDFKLPGGFKYLKESILLSYDDKDNSSKELLTALSQFFKEKYFFKDNTNLIQEYYKYGKYVLCDKKFKFRLYAEFVFDQKKEKEFYPEDLSNKIFENGNLKSDKDSCISDIKKAFENDKKETDFFRKCKTEFDKTVNDANVSIEINRYIAGVLDFYFHTIINPVKFGSQRFSKIFNYYWACYFSIVNGILKNIDKTDSLYKEFYENEKLCYKKILEKISDFTDRLYKKNLFEDKVSYYHYIKKHLQEKQNYSLSGVITTNYFNFAECELNEPGVNFAYPNGQLKLFEFPESLEVKDITKDCKTDGSCLFFPFIFGQSYVKPIIHPIQIKEFAKIDEILSDSELLVVLGYGINEDDSHLNAYLHDFANKHNILIVTNEDEKIALPKYKARLRIGNENLHICNVNYNSEKKSVIEKIFEKLVSI